MKGVVPAGLVLVVLLLAGSALYWIADGRPGSPAEFRTRVEETGLAADWRQNGPRGGAGVVTTDCGPVEVSVNEVDDELWIRVDDRSRRLTTDVAEALARCEW